MSHRWLASALLDSPPACEFPELFAVEVDGNTEQAEECGDSGVSTKRSIVTGGIDEVGNAVAGAEADESSKGGDDHEDRARPGRVRIKQVCDASDVGSDKSEVVATESEDNRKPVVLLWVLASETVKNGRDDRNDNRDPKEQQTSFRLVDTTVAPRAPLDHIVGSITKKGQCDESYNDLTGVDVASVLVRPVVWRRSENARVGGGDGNVDAECQAVETERPQNARE